MEARNMKTFKIGDKEVRYLPLVTIKCIYCGLEATVVEFVDEFEGSSMGTLHAIPECSSFVAMDPITYLSEHRKKFEKDIAEGKVKPN